MADAKIEVQLIGDASSLERAFKRSASASSSWRESIEKASRGGIVATVGFRGLGRSVAFASASFLGGAGLVAATKKSIEAASDLNEQINKTSVLFGASAGVVVNWSRSTDKALGISQRAALGAAGAFGSILETAGLNQGKAAQFSTELVKLAADMASFNNIDPTVALEKLRSGLAGEAEPLRTVGVLLSETRVQQEAYATGIAKAGSKLTDQQKVLARYSIILKDTAKQQGDFARTSGGLANQQRILAAQVDNLQAHLGAALLPDVLKIVSALNKWLASSENQKRVQGELANAVHTGEQAVGAFLDVARPLASVIKEASDELGGMRNTVKLLLAALIAKKVVDFSTAITGLGTSSAASAGKVNTLRAALLRLGAIGVITLGVEVVLNRKSIEDKVDNFLRGHHLGFLASKKLELPVPLTINNLQAIEQYRNGIAKVAGENSVLVAALDKVIERLEKQKALQDDIVNKRNAQRTTSQEGHEFSTGSTGGNTGGGSGDTATFAKRLQRIFNVFDLQLSRAQLTVSTKDDLAVLQKQLSVVRGLLAAHKGSFALRQKEVDLQSQILGIQREQADALNEQKKAASDAAAVERKAAKEKLAAQRAAAQQALEDARNQAQSLFGSFFQKIQADATNPLLFLGGSRGTRTIQQPGTSGADLLAALKQQNQSFSSLLGNISKLSRAGAPGSLIAQARSGQISPEQVAAIANASRRTQQGIFSQVRRADKLIAQAAKAEVTAKTMSVRAGTVNIGGVHAVPGGGFAPVDRPIVIHNHVSLDGKEITQSQTRTSKRRANQRRGRVGGHR